MQDDNEEFSYISSVDPYQAEQAAPSVDVEDEKALKRVALVVDGQIALYHTISGMKQFNTEKFTAEQREALCSQYVMLLSNLKQSINNAIKGIKEKSNG